MVAALVVAPALASAAPPEPPTALSASVGGTCVTFTWSAAAAGASATGFRLELGSVPGSANLAVVQIGNVLTHSMTLPLGTYFAAIRATNGDGSSGRSNEITVTTTTGGGGMPLPPVNPQAGVVGDIVTFSWQPPASGPTPDAYEVRWSPRGFFSTAGTLRVTGSTATTQIPTGQWQASVYSVVGVCTSQASAQVFFDTQTVPQPPGAPSSLTATVSGSRVTFSWQPPTSGGVPSGYQLEAGLTSGNYALGGFSTGSANTSFVVDAVPDGTYFVRVRALNPAGLSAPTNEVQVSVGSPGSPPGPPQSFQATGAGNSVQFSWQPPASGGVPSGYLLEAGNSSGLTNLGSYPVAAGTVFTVQGVPPGIYFVRLRASNAFGVSAPSNEVSFAVGESAAPGPPMALAATVVTRAVTLTWAAPTTGGAPSSYLIEVGRSTGVSDVLSFGTGSPQTGFSAAGVPTATYFVRVRALNALGLSAPSNEIVIVVP